MGGFISKWGTEQWECRDLKARIYALEEEMKVIRWKRDQERKKWKEQVSVLRKKLEEEEGRRRAMEEEMVAGKSEKEWQLFGTFYLVEQMKEEQERREQAVEKWKQLYLAIKSELDDLIHRTRQGEEKRLCWGAEDDAIEGLQRDLRCKEETENVLNSRLATMEKEGAKREREIDILKQSLRILNNAKRNRCTKKKNLQRNLHYF